MRVIKDPTSEPLSRTGGFHDSRIEDAVWSLDVGCPGGGGTSRFIVT